MILVPLVLVLHHLHHQQNIFLELVLVYLLLDYQKLRLEILLLLLHRQYYYQEFLLNLEHLLHLHLQLHLD